MTTRSRLLFGGLFVLGSILGCNLPGFVLSPPTDPQPEPLNPPTATPELLVLPTLPPTATPLPTVVPASSIASGERALSHGDWEQAMQEFRRAASATADPDLQAAALLGEGKARYEMGDYRGAIDLLEQLLRDYPQSAHVPYAHFVLGECYTALERHSEAADAFLNYLAHRSGLVDAYVLNLRGDALLAAGRYTEAAQDYRAALQSPSFLDPLEIQVKLARTHALAGDYQTAIALYDEVYNRTTSDALKARMAYLKGEAFAALGQMQEAYAAYLDAVNNYPTAYDSYRALVVLVEANVPVDDLNRGIVDYFAGQYGVALAAFDRYFQKGGPNRATALYYYGLTLRATGAFEEALEAWDTLIAEFPEDRFWDDAWDQKAYTLWNFMKDYNAAIEVLLNFVQSAPNHPRAAEFLFDAGLVAEMDGQLQRAAEIWEKLEPQYPASEYTYRGIFLAGISRYRLGDYNAALALFGRAAGLASSPRDRAAAYLWQGKCQKALGDEAAAQVIWGQAVNIDPTGYYSERARELILGQAPFTPPQMFDFAVDLEAERLQAEEWLRARFQIGPETDLSSVGDLANDPRYRRGLELWRLGLYDEARLEFEDLRRAVSQDVVNSFRLMNAMLELGAYRLAIFSARQVLSLAGYDDATSMSAPLYFNHIRFGLYFRELILPVAQKYQIHPLLLFSIVRQESAFEGFVRSSAGARGLMQIMPATGEEIARNLGWPPNYTATDLYRPQVSIEFGAYYLSKWRNYFQGDLYAALAAYNGGPGNAMAWHKLANGDPDLFLEVIRFSETRNYLRGVYEIFSLYRRIYNRTP
ncbi:MAG: tetratricopeptide repeat protein [Anaerolineales bacterium]|nr:tetratricopeptide repeat protein [Anaerolineales bacterium]MDW8448263.1 tetratricopeptide repeat protein [Anaerolineales bacterium]